MTTTIKITANKAASIVLPVKVNAIKTSIKKGNDLVITLQNGQVLVLENYFDNEPKLLANGSAGSDIQQLTLDPNGNITGIKTLSSAEIEAAVGAKNVSSLSTETADVLLFTPPSAETAAGAAAQPTYLTEALVATAVAVGGMFWIAERSDKGVKANPQAKTETNTITNPDGSSTTITKEDTDGDGKFDTTTTVEKDKNGNTTSTTVTKDTNEDGTPESETTTTPKADGSSTVVTKEDTDGDGKFDTTTTVEKDKNGNTTSTTVTKDMNEDGTPESETTTTPKADGSSTVVTKEDTDNDGKFDTTTTVEKDKNGNTTSTTVTKDMNEDGTPESETTTTVKADGSSTVVTKEDTDNDGKFDTTTTTEKDPTGKTTSTTVVKDMNEDGTPESETTTTVKADGSSTVVTKEDTDNDGKFDTTTTVEKDAAGKTTSTTVVKDMNEDGTPESETTTTVKADGSSTVVTKEDTDNDGKFDTTTTTEKDPTGKTTSTTVVKDMNEDGTPESETTTTVKADGSSTVVTKEDTDNDGKFDTTTTVEKDTAGKTTSTTVVKDMNEDGTPESETTTTVKADGSSTVVTKEDTDNDGKFDTVTTTEKAPTGKELSKVITKDMDEDGTVEVKTTTTTAPDGSKTTITETDTNDDGKVDGKTRATDADGDGKAELVEHLDVNNGDKVIQRDIDADDNGVVEKREFDADADDKNERVNHYDNTTGELISAEVDRDDNGVAEVKETYTNGKLAKKDFFGNDESTKDTLEKTEYFNDKGEKVRVTYPGNDTGVLVKEVLDTDSNGVVDTVKHNPNGDAHVNQEDKLGASGNETDVIESKFDRNDDGTFDAKVTYSGNKQYDTDKSGKVETGPDSADEYRPSKAVFDNNLDGKTDRIEHYQRDDFGRVTETKTFNAKNGVEASDAGQPDSITTHKYDDANNTETRYINHDGKNDTGKVVDGVQGVDEKQLVTYDDKGRITSIQYDTNADGVFDRSETLEYEGDSENVSRKTLQENLATDNTPDRVIEYSYDANGNQTEARFYNDGNAANENGKADRVEKYTYDTNGYLVKTNINADGSTDGSIDETITYTNNAQGESVKIEYDYNPSNPANPQTDKADRIEYLVRDGNGVVVEKFVDSDGDSTTGHNHNKPAQGDKNLPGSLQGIDRIESYVIDGQGQITEARYNFDGNNQTGDTVGNTQGVDQVDYIVRDAHGRETDRYRNLDAKISTGHTKTLSDGRTVNGIDNSSHETRDAKGDTYKVEQDRNADGKIDYTEYQQRNTTGGVTDYYINRDGKDGETTGKTQTMNVDGKEIQIQGIDANRHRDLDAYNRTIRETQDHNNDGNNEFETYHEYNANGHLALRHSNRDGKDNTGTSQTIRGEEVQGIEQTEVIETNARGNWIKVEYNNDADKGGNNGEGVKDLIAYNVVDANDRTIAHYVNSDGKDTGETIKLMIDGKEVTLTGIDRFETREYNANGQLIQLNKNLDAKGDIEEVVYYDRDEYGREKGVYTDLDNSKATGTGAKDGGEAITLSDGRVLNGVDTYYTHEHNAAGQVYQINRNRDAKGAFDEVEYRDINSQTGQVDTIYLNRDNDRDPTTGESLAEKSGNTFEITVDGQTKTIEGIDSYTEYTRNDNNQVIEERFNLDADANKQIDRIYYYDLDANGRRIGEYQNLDNNAAAKEGQTTGNTFKLHDGRTVEGIERAYFKEYNANGQTVKQQENLDADTKGITEGQVGSGQIEKTIYIEVDSAGREIKRYENVDNDTLPSGKANPTGKAFTINGQQVSGIDKVTTHERDGNGNIVKTTVEDITLDKNGEYNVTKTTVTTRNYNERNQEIGNEIDTTTAQGTEKTGANAYTYDVYGRHHTRSFDNNFGEGKDGFDRRETHHRDIYGRSIRIDNDNLGVGSDIDSYRILEYNLYNQNTVNENFTGDKLSIGSSKEFDAYGRTIVDKTYSINKDTPTQIYSAEEFDEYGRVTKWLLDRGVIGTWDAGDYRREVTYDPIHGKRLTTKETVPGKDGDVTSFWRYELDDYLREVVQHKDDNENGIIDNNERNHRVTYHGTTGTVDVQSFYDGEQIDYHSKWRYDASRNMIGRLNSKHDFSWINYDGNGTPRNTVEDYTSAEIKQEFQPFAHRFVDIYLTNSKAKTDITLDKEVIAMLAKDTMVKIFGDATDSVRIKGYSEFAKAEEKVTISGQTYDKLTTTVGDKEYTLLVDTDIHLFNADSNVEIM